MRSARAKDKVWKIQKELETDQDNITEKPHRGFSDNVEDDPLIAEIQSKILDTREKLEEFLAMYPATAITFSLKKVCVAFKVPPYFTILEDGTVIDERGTLN